jgi:anti-sigma regulatory factor (Ser/Thr protein kinase)
MNADPHAQLPTPGRPAGTGEIGSALLVLDQRFDIDGLYQLRAAVAAHAAELGLPAELANDVVIAVHELASNSVRHGPGHGRLRVWAVEQALTCEVTDDGGAPTGAEREPWAETTSPDTAGLPWPVEPGHGLWLADKVADRFAVRRDSDGVCATVTFRLQR